MDGLVKEFETVVKRQRILASSTQNGIDSLIEVINECRARCTSPNRSERRTSDGETVYQGAVKKLLQTTKEESERCAISFMDYSFFRLSAEHKDFYGAFTKFGKTIDKVH